MSETAERLKSALETRKKILENKETEYDYGPLGDKLKPGAELHDKLVRYANDIATRGYAAMTDVYAAMQEADWKATGFVSAEQADPRNEEKDTIRNVIIPLSFRMEEILLGAANGVFNNDPVFKWKPFPGPDSLINAAVMEYMVQRHMLWFDGYLNCDSVFRNAYRYGWGIAGTPWCVERARRPVDRQLTDNVFRMAKERGVKIPTHLRNKMIRDLEEQIICEGTEIQPWDPYTSFFDDSVSPNKFKRAAYKGTLWTRDVTQLLLYERESQAYYEKNGEADGVRWFNGWYAKILAEKDALRSMWNKRTFTGRENKQGTTESGGISSEFFSQADVLCENIKIIPSDWGVGDETYPVDYFLAVAGDTIVVGFGPMNLMGGGDDTAICAPNADGHTFIPVSNIMVTSGIQDHIDTVARCTAASLVKNINGGWTIFNHNILDWDDFMDSSQVAKVIRPVVPMLTKEMMEAAILNIPHIDVTQPHMQHVDSMIALASELNGTADIGGPGELANSERPTKYGMMAQVNSTSSRFRRLAFIMGSQFMSTIGWKMAYNMIQFGQQQQQIDLAGRFADRIRRELGYDPTGLSFMIDPRDINLNFEMEPYTGALPQQDDMSGMSDLLGRGLAVPEIAMQLVDFPWRQMLMGFARKSGFEQLDDYAVAQQATMQPMPDEQVMQQQQAGNIVPIGEMRAGL